MAKVSMIIARMRKKYARWKVKFIATTHKISDHICLDYLQSSNKLYRTVWILIIRVGILLVRSLIVWKIISPKRAFIQRLYPPRPNLKKMKKLKMKLAYLLIACWPKRRISIHACVVYKLANKCILSFRKINKTSIKSLISKSWSLFQETRKLSSLWSSVFTIDIG